MMVFSASSCNKWLDLKPQDGIIREDFWKTKEQLNSAVVGAYSTLLPAGTSGNPGLVWRMLVWGELRADMMGVGMLTSNNELDFWYHEILPNSNLVNWASLYTTINACNTVIQFAPQVPGNDNTLSQEQLNAYLAEMHGLRAMMYFYLLRLWGEVPLQLKASSSDSQIEQLPKSSKEEVYKQIVADLDFAIQYAPESYGAGNLSKDKGRLTQYSVSALQADVYLWGEEYAKCIEACERIENSGKFGLIDGSDPINWFRTLYVDGNSVEGIFEIQFDRQTTNPWFVVLAGDTYRYSAQVARMDAIFGIPDPATPTVQDIRANGGSYSLGAGGKLWKHAGTSYEGTGLVSANTSDKNWIIYRYADVLLMKAEALAWTNRGQEALDIVNVIRNRAGALAITAEPADPSSAYEVSDYILNERAREFAFEGKRWFDLLRHAKRNNYERKAEVLIDAVAAVAPSDRIEAITNKLRDYRSHYLPIAVSELQADKLLEQNPFYKTN